MKIVQTPVRFCPAVGGVEKYVLDLSCQLINLGHQVTVVCADEPHSTNTVVNGILVRRMKYWFKLSNTNITPGLMKELMNIDFDLIHTHIPTPWSAEVSLKISKMKGKPCVLTYHNDVEKKGLMGVFTYIYNHTILQYLLSQVDRILITQPRYLEDSLYLSRYREKIDVIPNGIATLPPSTNTIRSRHELLFVGVLDTYHRYKGLDILIRAIHLLNSHHPEIHLNVVGKGKLVSEYKVLASSLGLSERVDFLGYVEHSRLEKLYSSCAVFILPSINFHEGFGIVLLEAMSHCAPVITTQVVGISMDIQNYNAGMVVQANDPGVLASAIADLLSNPEIAYQMGVNGRNLIAQKYMWSSIAPKLEKIYGALM